ncbi:MAG: glycosyltransferase [Clostridia bacterium]|nr:glycosyltransferase [Clostridia bacterium]
MKMSKICVIYNMAAKYRAPIFQLMDKKFDIDWYYGYQIDDIKEMDASLLQNVAKLKRTNLFGPFYWQHGVLPLIHNLDYTTFIALGDLFALSTWGLLIKRKFLYRDKKVYLWSHGWYGREGRIKRWLKKKFFGLADGTFLYGNYAREIAIQQGNNPDKLWVIHNSLDHAKHIELRKTLTSSNIYENHFNNSDPTLIFIGRLTKVKQLDLIIYAVHNLKLKGENYNLILVGDGEERKNLEVLAKKLNVDVWFYGGCYDDSQTAQLIFDADICISPGNVGLTAMHTMSFGTPVLTHSNFANQMPEFEAIKEGETGSFFSEGSIDSLVQSISNWFKTNKNRESVRKKCYEEIDSNWTPEFQLNCLLKSLK